MELESRYQPEGTENKWYAYWENKKYFKSIPDHRPAFTVVIPPPNITGVLHMGHMLNNTIQDILIRRARLMGYNACWVPGTDHASIATEAKVVQMLRENGIKKSDISREEFLKHAFEWKDKYGSIILHQLRQLGASCDWDRTAFTMDEVRSESVIKAFVDLYNKGKLYRGKRMVNWDPEAKTVLSNEEVLHKEESAQLFYIRYYVEGSQDEYVTIATQRPETIMADSAVAVNPKDPRFNHFHGRKVIIPLINKSIPIILDEYVDIEFGTGALKVTPAHDQNDFELGKKHQLEIIDILNEDGTLNDAAQLFIGEDRFMVRKKIKKFLEEAGVLEKVEPYLTNIGRSERTNAVVEPRLSLQWYVDTKQLAEPALKAVMDKTIHFLPDNMKNTYKHWMENIRDWCISRQLWWGHRIPAYYYQDEVFVATTPQEALKLAQLKYSSLTLSDLKQDEDVLDTWFSSWLWPISVFEGPTAKEDLAYYYPTSVLVTGWDIIFLWVARMIMAGYEWSGTFPFKTVYFTGMVRDKQRRKMSKSLGNSPDALELIKEFGADGVRFGMLACSPAGGDLLFDDKLCEQGRNFSNKIWNAVRLIKGWHPNSEIPALQGEILASELLTQRTYEIIIETNELMDSFKLSEALKLLYSFIWEDFCGFYLEAVKPKNGTEISAEIYKNTIEGFEIICTLLHPFMPFITEEVWHQLSPRVEGDDCIASTYPIPKSPNTDLLSTITEMRSVITQIRELRNKYGIKMSLEVPLYVLSSEHLDILHYTGVKELLIKLGHLSTVERTTDEISNAQSFIGMRHKYFIDLPIKIDIDSEKVKLKSEIDYTIGFINSIQKKLSNEKFIQNAPPDLLEKERKKLADGETRLKSLEETLTSFNG